MDADAEKWAQMKQMTPEQVDAQYAAFLQRRAAEEAEKKNKPGRPLKGDAKRLPISVCITGADKEVMRIYGKGNVSQGITRAAKLIAKYDLYNREDL